MDFVQPAFAQAAGTATASPLASLAGLMPIFLIFAIMYFLMIRPQQKKAREHQAMITAVRRGDQVITQGGVIGKVVKVKEDNEVEVEIAPNVKVRVVKSTLVNVVSKGEPAES